MLSFDGLMKHNGHLSLWLMKFQDHTMPDIVNFTVYGIR